MNLKEEQEFYELIRIISKGLKKHGMKKVINALKKINLDNEEEVNYSITDFIEKSVCINIGVPRAELYGFDTRGEITVARKLCMLLIRKYIPEISDDELGGHYNRSRQVVFNTEKEFRTLKIGKANKFHIDLIELYNSLDKEISTYIKSLKKSRK